MSKVGRIGSAVAVVSVGVMSFAGGPAGAGPVSTAPGYWLAGTDGGVFSFNAPFYGSGSDPVGPCRFSRNRRAHSMDRSGAAGSPPPRPVPATGCSTGTGTRPPSAWPRNSIRRAVRISAVAGGAWTGIASSPTGNGFYLASGNGAVVSCGDAVPIASGLDQSVLAAPVVGIAAMADVRGYWLVGADGGVFAFGDAAFERITRRDAPQRTGGRHRPDPGRQGLLVGGVGWRGLRLRRCGVPRVHECHLAAMLPLSEWPPPRTVPVIGLLPLMAACSRSGALRSRVPWAASRSGPPWPESPPTPAPYPDERCAINPRGRGQSAHTCLDARTRPAFGHCQVPGRFWSRGPL